MENYDLKIHHDPQLLKVNTTIKLIHTQYVHFTPFFDLINIFCYRWFSIWTEIVIFQQTPDGCRRSWSISTPLPTAPSSARRSPC